MKIVIPDDYQRACADLACLSMLKDHQVIILGDLERDPAAKAALAEAEALVLIRERTRIDADFLGRTPRLRCISQTGKVSGHIDLDACAAAKVVVMEGTGSPVAPAELTWALILAARRGVVPAAHAMRHGQWQTNIGDVLDGQTIGIWGYGKIGRRIAGYARAFGMRVLVWGSPDSRHAAESDGLIAAPDRAAFFAESDVITVHLRLAPATRGIITQTDLARMKPSALFVNTSRAELVAPRRPARRLA